MYIIVLVYGGLYHNIVEQCDIHTNFLYFTEKKHNILAMTLREACVSSVLHCMFYL